jgi:hypothetical protein
VWAGNLDSVEKFLCELGSLTPDEQSLVLSVLLLSQVHSAA